MNISSTRNLSIDLIKIIAMCMVVCLHTTHGYIQNQFNINYILYNLSVAAIPLFFMVSGYLLLGRQNASYNYSFKKVFAILRFTFILIGAYWLIYSYFKGFNIKILVSNFFGCFIQKGQFGVFWYFGAMCMLYFLYPLLNKIYYNKKNFLILWVIFVVIQSIAFNFNMTGKGELSLIQTFRFWNWLSYFMLGGLLKQVSLKKYLLILCLFLSGVAFIFITTFLYPYMNTSFCEFFYSNILVIFFVSSIFLLCKDININKNNIIKTLSSLFLPVYALHIFVIRLLTHFGPYYLISQNNPWGGVFLWFTTLCIAIIISLIIIKIPIVNKIFKI